MTNVTPRNFHYRKQYAPKSASLSSKRARAYRNGAESFHDRRNGKSEATRRSKKNIRIKIKNLLDMPLKTFSANPPIEHTTGKKRFYFSGTANDVPPNLPTDRDTGSKSVHNFFGSSNIVNDGGDRGMVITNAVGHPVAILAPSKLRKSIFNNQSASTMDAILSAPRNLGQHRSHGKQPVSATVPPPPKGRFHTTRGPKCSRNSRGIIDLSHRMEEDHRDELYRLILQVEYAYKTTLEPNYIKEHIDAMNKCNVPGFYGKSKKKRTPGETRIFPTIAFGKSVYLPVHTDKDAKLSVASVCDTAHDESNKDEILAYFCFPGKWQQCD